MDSNPLKVEVEFRPQYVGNPCAVILFRLGQPFSIFVQDWGARAEVRLYCYQRGSTGAIILIVNFKPMIATHAIELTAHR